MSSDLEDTTVLYYLVLVYMQVHVPFNVVVHNRICRTKSSKGVYSTRVSIYIPGGGF